MRSDNILSWPNKAANRAMLRALGFKNKDFEKYQIGIASTWSNTTPCNNHINVLSKAVEYGVNFSNNFKATIFNTITVSDGISNGNKGMKYSLLSREIISSSIEIVSNSQNFDGIIAIGGCDKNIPGSIMGICKVNIPSIFIYGGTILPGKNRQDIITVFESLGKYYSNNIKEEELKKIEKTSIIGSGSCSGMYTANSMAIATEIMGISLPNSSVQNAQSINKIINCINSGKHIIKLVKDNIKPRDIINKISILNAIKFISLLGGSTNCYLHLLALANFLNINLNLNDIKKIANNLPLISDLKPSGKYFISDLINSGGIQKLLKFLIESEIINGDNITVTGKTLKQNLKNIKINYFNKIIKNLNKPIKIYNQIRILKGNISTKGCIAKISGNNIHNFIGKCKIFNSEEESVEYIYNNEIVNNTIIVIKFEGPKGGPGMREMLTPTSALIGKGFKNKIALITDGRFSGGSHGFVIGHVSPEAYNNGNINAIRNNDIIFIDPINNKINLFVDKNNIKIRKKNNNLMRKIVIGILNLYKKFSTESFKGAIFDYE